MVQLKNYREVGVFDLLSAPLNPIGAFDAESFKVDVQTLIDNGSKYIAVDLSGIDFLYSDAYNALMLFQKKLIPVDGIIGLLTSDHVIVDGLRRAGLDKSILIFDQETAIIDYSIHLQENEEKKKNAPEEEQCKLVAHTHSANVVWKKPRSSALPESHPAKRGSFTKSFNSIPCETKKMEKEGLDSLFEEKSVSHTWSWLILAILFVLGGTALLLLR